MSGAFMPRRRVPPLYIVERAIGFEDAPTATRRPAPTLKPTVRLERGEGMGAPGDSTGIQTERLLNWRWDSWRLSAEWSGGRDQRTAPCESQVCEISLVRDLIATAPVLRFTLEGARRSGR